MEIEKRRKIQLAIAITVILLVAVILSLHLFYFRKCENKTCFNDYLRDCKKAQYTSFSNMTFHYKILGKEDGNCSVNIKMLKGDFNNQDSLKLETKDMTCSLPLGVVMTPESDISLCHGLLKEGLQDLIIQKMHRYIVQNLGKINEVY